MDQEVGNKTKKGLFWDLIGSFIRQFASVFVSIILARLLSPVEFGLIGLALVFVNITEVFIDVGFTSGLIQKKEVKSIVYSSIFYVNLSFSIVLSCLIIIIAPAVAEFYGEPKVRMVLIYLSIIPIIAAFGRVQATILTKNMDFKSLSIRTIVSTAVGGILGVLGAFLGMGVYCLVIQQIATVLTSTILLWASIDWRPKWEFSKAEIHSLIGYSSYVFFDQALRQIFNKIDTVFIAKVYSTATLGFYSRAESLKAQIDTYTTGSLRKVMFPALSSLQDDPQSFIRAYHKAFNIITGIIVLLMGPIFFLSNDIIIGLLGVKWHASIIFFQILIFSTLTSPHIGLMAQAVLASGFSKLKFQIGLLQRLLKLMPIFFGYWLGVIEFSIAVVFASTSVFVVYAYVVHKKLNLNFGRQMKNIFVPNILFMIFILFFMLFREFINPWLFSLIFIVSQITYLKLIQNESYIIIRHAFITVINKKIIKY